MNLEQGVFIYIKDLILFRLVGGLLRPELERWVGHILQGELSSLSLVLSPLSRRSHISQRVARTVHSGSGPSPAHCFVLACPGPPGAWAEVMTNIIGF